MSNFKHGLADKIPEYCTWESMKTRCYNPNYKYYKDYGGRGITVCDRWLNSFINFFKDMGERPTSNHSIERIDNNLGYFPENCKWATNKEQNRNRQNNINITFQDKTQCLADLAKELGMNYSTLFYRFKHWPIEKFLNQIR